MHYDEKIRRRGGAGGAEGDRSRSGRGGGGKGDGRELDAKGTILEKNIKMDQWSLCVRDRG